MRRQGRASPLPPSRPLAGRVGCVSEANADGVGGLRLLLPCNDANNASFLLVAPPTPDPSPPRAARAGGGERRQLA
jgi:hypothetical protein